MRNRVTGLVGWSMVSLLAGMVWVACGDDEVAEGGDTDVALDRDAASDVSDTIDEPDAVEEVVPDGDDEPDLLEEVEPDLPLTETLCDDELDDDGDGLTDCADDDCICEICNDLRDNDDDDLIDCADPSCSDDPLCPEICENQEDDDADGDTDCEDDECAETHRCTEEPVSPDDYAFSPLMGYFVNLQYPPEGDACCFDFTGDSEPDNKLLQVLAGIPDYDAQGNMYASINMGDILLLVEWLGFPDDLEDDAQVAFNLYRGVAIDPAPPLYLEAPLGPETNLWNDGNGVFQVTRDGFDDLGPAIRFEDAWLEDGVMVGGPHFIRLTVPIPDLGIDLQVTLHDVQIEANLERVVDEEEDVQIRTIPEEITTEDGTFTVGGGRLGGYVTGDSILEFLNEAAAHCDCATPAGASHPLIAHGEQPAPNLGYLAECNWVPLRFAEAGYTCGDDDSPLCPHMYDLCGLAAFMPYLLDVDKNKNGVFESISAGLYFDVVGATLTDPPVEPGE